MGGFGATVILNFIGVKMTINCDYDSVVGVILPVENKILPIVHLNLKVIKTHPFFTLFAKNKFLIVVKMAAPLLYISSVATLHQVLCVRTHTPGLVQSITQPTGIHVYL